MEGESIPSSSFFVASINIMAASPVFSSTHPYFSTCFSCCLSMMVINLSLSKYIEFVLVLFMLLLFCLCYLFVLICSSSRIRCIVFTCMFLNELVKGQVQVDARC